MIPTQVHYICLLLACICFAVGFFGAPRLNWLCGGLFFITLGLLIR
jgi:hypothetical protein